MKLALICPNEREYCGVYDYTNVLAKKIRATKQDVLILTNKKRGSKKEKHILRLIDKWSSLRYLKILKHLKQEKIEFLNIQYVSWLYQKYGCPISLVIFALICRLNRISVSLTVHENYVPFYGWKWSLLAIPQRLCLWSLILFSKKTFVVSELWTKSFKRLFFYKARTITCLPNPSNFEPNKKIKKKIAWNTLTTKGEAATGHVNIHSKKSLEDYLSISFGKNVKVFYGPANPSGILKKIIGAFGLWQIFSHHLWAEAKKYE